MCLEISKFLIANNRNNRNDKVNIYINGEYDITIAIRDLVKDINNGTVYIAKSVSYKEVTGRISDIDFNNDIIYLDCSEKNKSNIIDIKLSDIDNISYTTSSGVNYGK